MGRRLRARAAAVAASDVRDAHARHSIVDGELAKHRRHRLADDPRARRRPPHLRPAARRRRRRRSRGRATTIDAAGYGARRRRHGRLTATLGARVDGWLLDASRLTPRVGTTPGHRQPADPVHDRSARVGAARDQRRRSVCAPTAAAITRRARRATRAPCSARPNLGLEQAWHVDAGGQWRRAPFALEAAGYARWLDDLRRARSRGHAAARAGAHAGRHGPRVRRAAHRARRRLARPVGLAQLRPVEEHAQGRRQPGRALLRSRSDARPDRGRRLGARRVERSAAACASSTGEPRTDVIGAFFDSRSGRFEPIVGAHNGVRLPAFFAADLRGERRLSATRMRGLPRDPEPDEPRERRGDHLQRRLLDARLPHRPAAARDRGREDRTMRRRARFCCSRSRAAKTRSISASRSSTSRACSRSSPSPPRPSPARTVTYRALVASPDGPLAERPHWAYCTAPKPPTEDNAVAAPCIGSTRSASSISAPRRP